MSKTFLLFLTGRNALWPRLGHRWILDVQHGCHEVAERHSQMPGYALLERGVVLRAAENIGHDLAENGAAAKELHHASGDRSAEERAAIEAAYDAGGEFEFAGESCAHPVCVHLRIAFSDGFAEKFSGAHRVEETFSGEWIDESGGVANQRPIFADNCSLRKSWNLRRWEDVAVKARGFD